MMKVVFAGFTASMVLVPVGVTAIGSETPSDNRSVQVEHKRLPDRICVALKESVAKRGLDTSGVCRYTSVLMTKDGPREVVGSPFVSPSGSSRTTADGPWTRHRFHVRHAKDYVWRICQGYRNNCTEHDGSPVWYYVRQKGRIWRGETCWNSAAAPYPHDCRWRFNWTKDNNWRRGSFRTKNRSGWHYCQRVSSSGVTTEIDKCWIADRKDPADVRTRYGRDKWKADWARVGMRWTLHVDDARQHRTGTSWMKIFVSGRIRKGGTW